jgi:hypothetical protein
MVTNLSVAASSGDTVITVTDSAALTVNDAIVLSVGTANEEEITITAINTTGGMGMHNLTVSPALANNHAAGALITMQDASTGIISGARHAFSVAPFVVLTSNMSPGGSSVDIVETQKGATAGGDVEVQVLQTSVASAPEVQTISVSSAIIEDVQRVVL